MSLDSFVTLIQIPSERGTTPNDLYAEAWGFFKFALSQCPSELKKYLDTLKGTEQLDRDTRTMRREFTAAFGPMSQVERTWRQFLDSPRSR
jgi:hypothetical protein